MNFARCWRCSPPDWPAHGEPTRTWRGWTTYSPHHAPDTLLLQRAANSFWLASRARRERYFSESANGLRSIQQHTALRDAVAAGNAPKTLEVLDVHHDNVERCWLAHLVPGQDSPAAQTLS